MLGVQVVPCDTGHDGGKDELAKEGEVSILALPQRGIGTHLRKAKNHGDDIRQDHFGGSYLDFGFWCCDIADKGLVRNWGWTLCFAGAVDALGLIPIEASGRIRELHPTARS